MKGKETTSSDSVLRLKPTARMIKRTAQFNKIVMDSYFQSKLFPSETEIAHFVKCVKIPVEIVRAYLAEKRKEDRNRVENTGITRSSTVDIRKNQHNIIPTNLDQYNKTHPSRSTIQPRKFSNIGSSARTTRLSPSSPRRSFQPIPQYDVDFDQLFSEGTHIKSPGVTSTTAPATIIHSNSHPTPTLEHQKPVSLVHQDPVSLVYPSQQAPLLQSGLAMLYGNRMVLSSQSLPTTDKDHEIKNTLYTGSKDFVPRPPDQNSPPQQQKTHFDLHQPSTTNDDWMTNDDVMFGDDDEEEENSDDGKMAVDNNDSLLEKKINTEMEDSGYLTNAESSLNLSDPGQQDQEQKEDADITDLMDLMQSNRKEQPEEVSVEKREEDIKALSSLRKIFLSNDEESGSTSTDLTVIGVEQAFKKNVFEVELSDGVESSHNFFFKMAPGSHELTRGHIIRLTSLRHIGARICVDAFEKVGKHENSDFDTAVPVEESFLEKLRRVRLDQKDLFELAMPKSLNDFVELEELVLHYISCHGGKSNPMKTLLTLSRSQQTLSSRLVKLLAKHLGMERTEVEAHIDQKRRQPALLNLLHDHDYCHFESLLL